MPSKKLLQQGPKMGHRMVVGRMDLKLVSIKICKAWQISELSGKAKENFKGDF